MAGAVLLFVTLSALHASTLYPFRAADEQAHYGYALSLAQGDLPTIDTRIPPSSSPELLQRLIDDPNPSKSNVWVANHPPLFALLGAAPAALGEATGNPRLGLVGVRMISVLVGAAAVALTGQLAGVLVPHRPRVAVIAASLVATLPLVTHVSGFAYNDALGMATATGALWAGALALRRGPTRGVVVAVSVTGVLAALSRASALPAAALAIASLCLAAGLAAPPRLLPRLRAALVAALVPGLTVTASAAWFYVRNILLYGGPTAADYLFQTFSRSPRPGGRAVLLDALFWQIQIRDYWRGFADSQGQIGEDWIGWIWLAFWILAGAALLGLLQRVVTRRLDGLLPWLPAVVFVPLLAWSVAGFVAGGGWPHPRYWMSALPVAAVVAARGLDHPAPRFPVLPLAVLVLQLTLGLAALRAYALAGWGLPAFLGWWASARLVLTASGMPAPGLVTALTLGLLVVSLGAICLGMLRTRTDEADHREYRFAARG